MRAPRRRRRTQAPPPHTTATVKLVAELSERQVGECRALTLEHSEMRPALERIRRALEPDTRNHWMLRALETERVVLIRRRRRLVAWALIQCVNPNVAPNAYFFVSTDHRRQGLGTFLLNEVLDRWTDAEVHPWDDRSFDFFSAQERSLRFHSRAEHFVERRRAESSRQ